MPRFSKLARTQSCIAASTIASAPLLLLPNTFLPRYPEAAAIHAKRLHSTAPDLTTFFFSSLSYASSCEGHRNSRPRFHLRIEPDNRPCKDRGDARRFHTARIIGSYNVKSSEEVAPRHSTNRQSFTNQQRSIATQNTDRKSQGHTPGFFESSTRVFAQSSTLPLDFYNDLERVAGVKFDKEALHALSTKKKESTHEQPSSTLRDQMQLLQSVRELEEKLSNAKSALNQSLVGQSSTGGLNIDAKIDAPVQLSKQDYLNLVDLYYYSHQSRFEPDSPDHSPTPLFLDDYSFELSRDFSEPTQELPDIDEEDISPLKDVQELLKSRQLKDITLMQAFVDLLLDDTSSNRALFEVYKMFPEPGVAYLPTSIIRLFLQRMSTPRQRSEKSMLRYLSVMDDMQRAKLRISGAEWSSAIYLAGRSFGKVTEGDVSKSFGIWREMEEGAGVKGTHVTFNILFDIAVRAEKHALAQNILKEMHGRGLRLNRLGRVSLIYYHGTRGDGDGVRRTYRDFVEAGEIVDTLVLNCVMASLIKAQEPVAAEQIYERMKQLQTRLRRGIGDDGEERLFMKYPPPGSTQIDMQMASNSLDRVLLNAARLRNVLPEHHQQLQARMPLTPDQITFRSMISHHASTSGDLDRLTVLLKDKTDFVGLPLTSLDFQLLFKGFAIHGEARGDDKWTINRLQLVWDSCMSFIRDNRRQSFEKRRVELPTIEEIDSSISTPANVVFPKKSDAWEEFILDLAAFPRERLKRPVPMSNTFFPEDADPEEPARISDVDKETEYSLPDAETLHQQCLRQPAHHNVEAEKNLVIWLIRAYQRCTRSRRNIEDVWFQVRKLWNPKNDLERDAVVRVLRKALRDCDHSGIM